jgi:hypothetical protein
VPFGSGGPPEYYYRLCKMIQAKYSDFKPEGMEEWEEEQSEDKILDADTKLKNIVSEMRKYIFDVFRAIHGDLLYWDKGITDKTVKTDAYRHRRLRKAALSSQRLSAEMSERAIPGGAAARKPRYSCRGQPESLLRWPTFTARFPRRRYLRINLFHGELIQALLFRAFPRRLEPFRGGRRGRGADADLLVLGNGTAQQAFDGHLLVRR